jgi:hypothetical protein
MMVSGVLGVQARPTNALALTFSSKIKSCVGKLTVTEHGYEGPGVTLFYRLNKALPDGMKHCKASVQPTDDGKAVWVIREPDAPGAPGKRVILKGSPDKGFVLVSGTLMPAEGKGWNPGGLQIACNNLGAAILREAYTHQAHAFNVSPVDKPVAPARVPMATGHKKKSRRDTIITGSLSKTPEGLFEGCVRFFKRAGEIIVYRITVRPARRSARALVITETAFRPPSKDGKPVYKKTETPPEFFYRRRFIGDPATGFVLASAKPRIDTTSRERMTEGIATARVHKLLRKVNVVLS